MVKYLTENQGDLSSSLNLGKEISRLGSAVANIVRSARPVDRTCRATRGIVGNNFGTVYNLMVEFHTPNMNIYVRFVLYLTLII
jgi:hypothetical protein